MKDVKEMTLSELKVFAYDEIMKLQIAQANLQVLNQEILLRSETNNEIK